MKRQKLFWWSAFGTATFALSKVFAASRLLSAESPAGSLWDLAFWLLILLLAFLVLGYDSYQKAKTEDKLVHHIWLYDKFNQFTQREKCQ